MAAVDPIVLADAIVNVLGAAGVGIVALDAWRADPRGPVARRVAAALALVGALFLVRGAGYGLQSWLLGELAIILAAGVPLAALVVAEGLLRRHAPRGLKLMTGLGLVAVVAATLIPLVPGSCRDGLLLALQLASFAAIGLLLWRRDPGSLSLAESQNIRRVATALAFVVPAIVTDFRFLLPDIPVRMGALGALLALYLGFGVAGTATTRARLATQLGFLAIAAVLALTFVFASSEPTLGSGVRAAVIACAGIIVAALMSESLGARAERSRQVDPLLLAATPAAFEAAIARHTLLAGSAILGEAELAHVRHPAFDALVAERPVLRLAEAPWNRAPTDDGVERARSLLTAYEATHLLRLSQTPMRLVAAGLPAVAADQRTENDLRVAQHIAQLLHSGGAAR